jgi:alcohol dehydrogenase class IV
MTEVDIDANDIVQLASDAMLQKRLLMNSPREITFKDAVEIYREAL